MLSEAEKTEEEEEGRLDGLWKEWRASFPLFTKKEKSRQECDLHNNIYAFALFRFFIVGRTSEDIFQERALAAHVTSTVVRRLRTTHSRGKPISYSEV